ncbi:NCS1 family nucleobase:cation symporter-1 [Sciscionella sediminilitoris]|uniref:NCS1 family nucleobase:cation symporter-1 n=1 Tax=Sciscionella sediminilitoris TaxID=1445613 RepID=UPI0004DF4FE4|nr:NCS1 family nucleobase:cation symporter-1 [Sciscionella sp. SE31]
MGLLSRITASRIAETAGTDPAASGPVSTALYNEDLAPTKIAGRRWRAYNIFTLWANDVNSLGNYTFAIGLFALGLGAWQVLLALMIGAALLFVLLNLSGYMGYKTGLPFPVLSRISFGIRGAQIPALIRGAVAIVWFGIQTYLASVVFCVMLIAIDPGLSALYRNSILGLSTLGWICFGVLWIVQVVILMYGLEMVRKYEAFAGPIILFTMGALAVWMFFRAGGSISWSTGSELSGAPMWNKIFAGGSLWIAIYGTFLLNFCDFTRSAKSKKSITLGNFWGLPINICIFGIVTVVLCGAQFTVNGQIIKSPTDIVHAIPNTFLLVIASLALLILTVAVNLMANFVAPAYAIANLFPKKLNFRRGGLISAIIGIVILPWNLYNSPVVVEYFLGGLGALLGPLFGVFIADYWLVRRARIDIPALYSPAPDAEYHYRAGVNPRAVLAFAVAGAIAVAVAFVPELAVVAPFSWLFGAGIAALLYYLIAERHRDYRAVSGESIAVSSTD